MKMTLTTRSLLLICLKLEFSRNGKILKMKREVSSGSKFLEETQRYFKKYGRLLLKVLSQEIFQVLRVISLELESFKSLNGTHSKVSE
jgi:hypothetical protein